jgi:hypothetical protein
MPTQASTSTAMYIQSAVGGFGLREKKEERIHQIGQFKGRWLEQYDHIKNIPPVAGAGPG